MPTPALMEHWHCVLSSMLNSSLLVLSCPLTNATPPPSHRAPYVCDDSTGRQLFAPLIPNISLPPTHPALAPFYPSLFLHPPLSIFLGGGQLLNRLISRHKNKRPYTEVEVSKIVYDILSGECVCARARTYVCRIRK